MQELDQWQSLSQLLKDMLARNFELEASIRLALVSVQQLESERTYTIPGNLPLQLEETSWTNRNEELD